MYASPTKCTQVGRGVRMQKKKKTRPKWPCVWHLTLRSGASITRGPPMLSPFVLAKGMISQVRRLLRFSAPFSRKERGETWIPEQFRSTWNKLQCMCQNGATTPLSCNLYQKNIAFMHIHLLFPAHMPFYSTQSVRLVVQHWTKNSPDR